MLHRMHANQTLIITFVRRSGERKGKRMTKSLSSKQNRSEARRICARNKIKRRKWYKHLQHQTIVPYWLQAYARIKISTFYTPYGLPDCNSTNGSSSTYKCGPYFSVLSHANYDIDEASVLT